MSWDELVMVNVLDWVRSVQVQVAGSSCGEAEDRGTRQSELKD